MYIFRSIRSLIAVLIIGLSAQTSSASVLNLFTLEKGNKRCVLFGEGHDLVLENIGKVYCHVFDKFFQAMAKSPKKSLCLLELTPSGIESIRMDRMQGKALDNDPIPYLADKVLDANFKLGSVTFKPCDRRDGRTQADAIGILHALSIYLMQEKEPIKLSLKKDVRYCTWQDYLDQIQQEKATMTKAIDEALLKIDASQEQIKAARAYVGDILKKFDHYSDIAKKWLSGHNVKFGEIFNVTLIKMHQTKREEISKVWAEFILPITGVVGDAIFMLETLQGLQSCDDLLGLFGANHTVRVAGLLEKLGFEYKVKLGDTTHTNYLPLTELHWITPADLAKACCTTYNLKTLDLSEDVEEASEVIQSMAALFKTQSSFVVHAENKVAQESKAQMCAATGCGKTALSHCARCKKVSYCSRECQKAHWKEHKPACKEADKSDK